MSYSDYRMEARQMLAGKWKIAVLVALVAALLGGLITGSGLLPDIELDEEIVRKLPEAAKVALSCYLSIVGVLSLVSFIMGGAVRQGYAAFLLKLHRGDDVEVNDLFSQFHRFGDGFLLALLEGLFVFLWSLLFIIPGIIAALSYAMAPYIMLENPELSASECLKASKELMQGHKGELFILELTFIGWDLLNMLTLGIGSLWLNPYKNAAHVAFYRDICPRSNTIDVDTEPID